MSGIISNSLLRWRVKDQHRLSSTTPVFSSHTASAAFLLLVFLSSHLHLCLGQCSQNCTPPPANRPWWGGWYIWAFVSFGIAIACGIGIHLCKCFRRQKSHAQRRNSSSASPAQRRAAITQGDDTVHSDGNLSGNHVVSPHSIYIITVQHDSSTDKPPRYTEIFKDGEPDGDLPSYSEYISKEMTENKDTNQAIDDGHESTVTIGGNNFHEEQTVELDCEDSYSRRSGSRTSRDQLLV